MTLLRAVARPMLATMFISGGVMALRKPDALAAKAQPVTDVLRKVAPQVPLSAKNLVRLNGVVHVAAGATLATGRLPRTSALVLAATMPATTVTGHPFWNETDPVARRNQFTHFMKNISLTGGLLLSTLDPDPHKPWLGSRAAHRAVAAKDTVVDQISDLRG
ncbi:DoxX family protein [Aeromicrobium duanguangcaii]|uniref:DoxX family protein n=1 Tax=Aeromicrobium duanguangcaii TaxID=2968086 RepID=A0ABY5KH60_9ACTN|nr:DoxX family protein [Aeromicrobium duanguangcaii]MCD9154887.1 DoxX family protein [Aeromicrobium duanguangcaii]MCL3839073.1 DoxX family protein [Aeromicrobium duanguangcaii]UUI67703.1 DoxX family protein [Aeromicrobium duanguangcaii]